jgi:hypothetical protein
MINVIIGNAIHWLTTKYKNNIHFRVDERDDIVLELVLSHKLKTTKNQISSCVIFIHMMYIKILL